ncbi:Eco47II family restriction endonuclease [Arcanobacterium canis]
MNEHTYGLSWIDEDELYKVTEHIFRPLFFPPKKTQSPIDAFAAVVQGALLEGGEAEIMEFERQRVENKTLSNKIGIWHQAVLGISPNFIDAGAAGGSVDLRPRDGFRHPVFNKPVWVEVKNRFNTIKGSDEAKLWDQLDILARSSDSIAYIIQIVPKCNQSYDRPWRVMGRSPRKHVRVCDGVTGYAMAFNYPDALRELLLAMPKIIAEVSGRGSQIESDLLIRLFNEDMPSFPAHP